MASLSRRFGAADEEFIASTARASLAVASEIRSPKRQPKVPPHVLGVDSLDFVMFSMFVLWIAVFLGIFFRKKWVPALAVVSLIWTLVLLRLHMTDPIPLSF